MILTLNGQQRDVPDGFNGAQLLELLNLKPSAVVVELNGEIIPKADFPQHELRDGDVLEMVTVVGGG